MKLKIGTLSSAALVLYFLGFAFSHAETVSIDRFTSSTMQSSLTGVTASLSHGASLRWGGSTDGTFGSALSGAEVDSQPSDAALFSTSNTDISLTVSLSNNSGSAVLFESFYFDVYRRYDGPGKNGWSLATGGGVSSETLVDTSNALPGGNAFLGTAGADYADIDTDLGSLADRLLADGETATITLTLKGASGAGNVWIDNIALEFTHGGFASRPNILFILADDLGYNDLHCYGNNFYETPRIDSLADDGLKLDHHYSAGSVCSPTRTSIITGKFPARTHSTEVYMQGVNNIYVNEPLICGPDLLISPAQPFLADELSQKGYRTAMYGKWHIEGVEPVDTGFDFWDELKLVHSRDGDSDPFRTDEINQKAMQFIDDAVANNEAFFLCVSHNSVHTPHKSTTANLQYFEAKGALPDWQGRPQVQTPLYAGMVKDLDDGVGVLLDKLAELGIEKDTLVVFTSDNGGLGDRNFPFRKGKSYAPEGGIRVPFIARWPGVIEPGTVRNDVVVSTDYFRTFLSLAGGVLGQGVAPDSEDFTPVLLNQPKSERAAAIFHFPHYRGTDGDAWLEPWSVIRKGDYSYIYYWENNLAPSFARWYDGFYNVVQDPEQLTDLTASNPSLAESMKTEMLDWLNNNGAQIPTTDQVQVYLDLFSNDGSSIVSSMDSDLGDLSAAFSTTGLGLSQTFGRGSNDGDFGTLSGADPDNGPVGGCLSNSNTALEDVELTITLNNNSLVSIELETFHFDAYRRYNAPGAAGWDLVASGSGVENATVANEGPLPNLTAYPDYTTGEDYSDLDVDLSLLSDRTLAPGEVAVFTLRLFDSTGSGALWLDNISIASRLSM